PDSSGKRSFLVAAVCLGLLCVLLAGIIGLSVHCEFLSKFIAYHLLVRSADNRAIKDYEDKRNNLFQRFSLYKINSPEERDQLQTSYNNLTEEKGHIQAIFL
ncbi:unnamed protein product, partial [Coregonus sp. 'balchen']